MSLLHFTRGRRKSLSQFPLVGIYGNFDEIRDKTARKSKRAPQSAISRSRGTGHIQVIHGSYTSPPIHHIEIERYLRMREAPNNQGKGKDPEFPKYDSARIRRSRRKHPEVSAVGTQTSCAIRLAPNRVPVFRILMSQCIDRINV